MKFLIKEMTTRHAFGTYTTTMNLGYVDVENEADVKEYCKHETDKLRGTYDTERIHKEIDYEIIRKLK